MDISVSAARISVLFSIVWLVAPTHAAPPPPNIIYIISDDQTWSDFYMVPSAPDSDLPQQPERCRLGLRL